MCHSSSFFSHTPFTHVTSCSFIPSDLCSVLPFLGWRQMEDLSLISHPVRQWVKSGLACKWLCLSGTLGCLSSHIKPHLSLSPVGAWIRYSSLNARVDSASVLHGRCFLLAPASYLIAFVQWQTDTKATQSIEMNDTRSGSGAAVWDSYRLK